jgi:hypothetical protein
MRAIGQKPTLNRERLLGLLQSRPQPKPIVFSDVELTPFHLRTIYRKFNVNSDNLAIWKMQLRSRATQRSVGADIERQIVAANPWSHSKWKRHVPCAEGALQHRSTVPLEQQIAKDYFSFAHYYLIPMVRRLQDSCACDERQKNHQGAPPPYSSTDMYQRLQWVETGRPARLSTNDRFWEAHSLQRKVFAPRHHDVCAGGSCVVRRHPPRPARAVGKAIDRYRMTAATESSAPRS